MSSYHFEVSVGTAGNTDVIDLTKEIESAVTRSGVHTGVAAIFVAHSTCGLTCMEYEPGAVADLQRHFARNIPPTDEYSHNRLNNDTNGHAHLSAAIMGPSLVIPVLEGKPVLGTWQSPVLVDFDDRPRRRRIHIVVR